MNSAEPLKPVIFPYAEIRKMIESRNRPTRAAGPASIFIVGLLLPRKFGGDGGNMPALEAGNGALVGRRGALALQAGKCARAIRRASGYLVHVHLFGARVGHADYDHAVVQ
jgi:hypothetical protein